MAILNALGLRAVGLKRRIPTLAFFFSPKSRESVRPLRYVATLTLLLGMLIYGSVKHAAPVVFLESLLLEMTLPVIGTLQKSFALLAEKSTSFFQTNLKHEVARLKLQNENLLQQNMMLTQALFLSQSAIQNARGAGAILENITTTHKIYQVTTLNAPALGEQLIIRSPKGQPLALDNMILGTRGLLGRIVRVDFSSARVMTIFDHGSRIPVDIHGTQGIAAGNGTSKLQLIYLKEAHHTFKVGDTAYTSGFGGVFLKGIPLGKIDHIDDRSITIAPFEKGEALHVVSVCQ